MNHKKFILKKDIVIPAGTIFESCDGMTTHYGEGNYDHVIGLTNNTSGRVVYGIDEGDKRMPEWFEEVN